MKFGEYSVLGIILVVGFLFWLRTPFLYGGQNLGQKRFFQQGHKLYCDGLFVTVFYSDTIKFWEHPNPDFISVYDNEDNNQNWVDLFYKGRKRWSSVETDFRYAHRGQQNSADRTFKVLNSKFACDSNSCFYLGNTSIGPLPDAPHLAFVFYRIQSDLTQLHFEKMRLLDSRSEFVQVGDHIFYGNHQIPVELVKNFKLLSNQFHHKGSWRYHYNLEDHVWTDTQPEVAMSQNTVFFRHYPSANIKPEGFELLNRNFFRYQNNIYYFSPLNPEEPYQLENRFDSASFQALCAHYSKDKNNVYVEGGFNILHEADPATFVSLGQDYGMDRNHVYYRSVMIENALLESFEIIGKEFSKDHQRVYFQNRSITGADSESFRLLPADHKTRDLLKDRMLREERDFQFALDKQNVYFRNKQIAKLKKVSANLTDFVLTQEIFRSKPHRETPNGVKH